MISLLNVPCKHSNRVIAIQVAKGHVQMVINQQHSEPHSSLLVQNDRIQISSFRCMENCCMHSTNLPPHAPPKGKS